MLTLIRIIAWTVPLLGLLKARDSRTGDEPFTPGRAARDLRRTSNSMMDHAETLPVEQSASLRVIARHVEDVRAEIVAWGQANDPRSKSRVRRWLGLD